MKLWAGLVLNLFSAAVCAAQDQLPPMTLEQAVSEAYAANRLLKASELEAMKSQDLLAAAKTLHLPQFKVYGMASRTFDPVTFTVPKGSLGVVPPLGLFPTADMSITAANDIYGAVAGMVTMPVSQHYKINMAVEARRLQSTASYQELRLRRQEVRGAVEQLFYGILQAQSGIEAALLMEKAAHDALADMENYRSEKAALESDYYRVKARFLRAKYDRGRAEDALADLKRKLNNALGRSLESPLELAPLFEPTEKDIPPEAGQYASGARPDVLRAAARAGQAGYDAKIKKAEYIPDLNLTVNYLRFINTSYIPQNISGAGLMLSWDIFDWGRRGHELDERNRTAQQAQKLLLEEERKAEIDLRAGRAALLETFELVGVASAERQAAAEARRVAEDKFAEHAILPKELYAARAAAAESELNYRKALADFYEARTRYLHASGEDL